MESMMSKLQWSCVETSGSGDPLANLQGGRKFSSIVKEGTGSSEGRDETGKCWQMVSSPKENKKSVGILISSQQTPRGVDTALAVTVDMGCWVGTVRHTKYWCCWCRFGFISKIES